MKISHKMSEQIQLATLNHPYASQCNIDLFLHFVTEIEFKRTLCIQFNFISITHRMQDWVIEIEFKCKV